MAGEVVLTETERGHLDTIRAETKASLEERLDRLETDLEKLAFLAGAAAAANQLDDVIRAARADGVWWTSIAWALGELTVADDDLKGNRAARRVSSSWRRREETRKRNGTS